MMSKQPATQPASQLADRKWKKTNKMKKIRNNVAFADNVNFPNACVVNAEYRAVSLIIYIFLFCSQYFYLVERFRDDLLCCVEKRKKNQPKNIQDMQQLSMAKRQLRSHDIRNNRMGTLSTANTLYDSYKWNGSKRNETKWKES